MINIKKRGFGSMSREKRSAIASLGGIAAHKKGTAHTWNHAEAVQAGIKGSKMRRKK